MHSIARALALPMLLLAAPAFANHSRADQLAALALKLGAVERQLSPGELDSLDRHIAGIERALARANPSGPPGPPGATGPKLACLSNGQSGSYEKFTLSDPATGAPYGKATSMQNCQQLLTVQSQGLLCVSNGESGSYEKFGLYDLARNKLLPGWTKLASCQSLVQRASGPFVCKSNGESGSYEKFQLYNRETEKALGGQTGFDQCLASMPR